MNKIIVIGSVLLLLTVLSSGCLDKEDSVPVNITYPVRDVHIGYVNGASIIMVEYIDGEEIKIVDNKMLDYVDPVRSNMITIKKTQCNESSLLHYEQTQCRHSYPKGRYILYLAEDKNLVGIKSNHPHSRRGDEETFLN